MHNQDKADITTPLRRQYLEIKSRYPGMILMFQIGDFYESFDEDAQVVSRELGVALTRKWFGKGQAHPLAGVPVRSIETHLAKLIHRGYKVAICEQTTPPGKGLVEREVTRIVTPGTVIEPGLLEGRANNYLAALIIPEGITERGIGRGAGFAYADITTGEFAVTEIGIEQAITELERIGPAELLLPKGAKLPIQVESAGEIRAVTTIDDSLIEPKLARKVLLDHFSVRTLAAFGCEDKPLAVQAASAIVVYLRDTQTDALANLNRLQTYTTQNFMQFDPQTVRNLEIFQSWDFTGGAPTGSLVSTIDLTATPMGARKLRRWLRQPLLDLTELRARQEAIDWFFHREAVRKTLRTMLDEALDIERLLGRIRRRLAVPAEIVALAQSLRLVPQIRALLEKAKAPKDFLDALKGCEAIVEFVARAITDRPPSDFERGNIIRPGFSTELDDLRAVLTGGKDFLAKLETREKSRTGIKSLKVGYNKVFGYYIEVTKPNLKLVPNDYIRKQTITNAERYFTLELKEHESLIANAKERILELEINLYRQTCDEISHHCEHINQVAATIAHADLCAALAECAQRFNYVKPELNHGDQIIIAKGRHPMIEHRLEDHRQFRPNDTDLSNRDCQIVLLTAPNMAGKSVYLRQVALISLLAQIGSFVPAESAKLGLVDRIFTRVGLHDYTLRGHSSFMVEMIEAAHILNHATTRSLVLLDEVGRGTSTADGLSIARSVIEYLHNNPQVAAKTLFATHYHELTNVEEYLPRVRNFHLAVRECGNEVEYLHQVVSGRAEKSFGIYVAQLAGLPKPVIHRAQQLLDEYDGATYSRKAGQRKSAADKRFPALLETLVSLDLNQLSPIEALTRLYELQRQAAEQML